jgi:hypothetical protein
MQLILTPMRSDERLSLHRAGDVERISEVLIMPLIVRTAPMRRWPLGFLRRSR